jgi:hypothetical protein
MFGSSPEYYCFRELQLFFNINIGNSFCFKENSRYFQLYNYLNGFKQAIDQVIISLLTGFMLKDPTMVKIQAFPCQGYIDDQLKAKFSFFHPS